MTHQGFARFISDVFDQRFEDVSFEDRVRAMHGRWEIPARDRWVIEDRYGLRLAAEDAVLVTGHRVMTLKQIADRMGVTGERIRQIEARGLRRIRKYVDTKRGEAA